MELILTLLLLYAVQCMAGVPLGTCVFTRVLGRLLVVEGGGWRLLHPLPSGRSWVGSRFPLFEDGGVLRSRGASLRAAAAALSRGPGVALGAISSAEARGAVVRVNGRPFARVATKRQARDLGALLGSLRGSDARAARERIGLEIARSLDLRRFEAESERLRRATRWLGRVGDVYFVLLIAAPAALTLWTGVEAALFVLFPVLGAAHLATLVSGYLAHRRLLPASGGERFDLLLAAGLYPPAALRIGHELRLALLGGFHPAVVAAATLPPQRRRVFLRGELARVDQALAAAGGAERAELRPDAKVSGPCVALEERRAILRLAGSIGLSREALLAPRPWDDPLAGGYCPVCLYDYRSGVEECSDCALPLVVYGGRPAPAAALTSPAASGPPTRDGGPAG